MAEAARTVIVSPHAVDRARLRFKSPDLQPREIRRDVLDALAAGREGVRPPVRLKMGPSQRRHDLRFAWTEDQQRLYLVRRMKDRRTFRPSLMVVTALVPMRGET